MSAENVTMKRRATDWQPKSCLTEHADGSVTLSHERLNVCLEATWELEALANVLPGLVPNVAEADGAHHVVRGLSDRINRLACVLMAGLGDEVQTVKALERKVFVGGRAAA